MKDRRWRRILGQVIAGQPFEEEFVPQVTVPFDLMRMGIPGNRQSGAGDKRNVDSAMGSFFADPPVGLFAANDTLAELPQFTEQFGTVIAPVAQVATASFAPGLWTCSFRFATASSSFSGATVLTLRPKKFDDLSPLAGEFDGSVGPGALHFRGAGGTTALVQWFDVEWYIPEEWKLSIVCGTSFADAATFILSWSMICKLALDGEGVTQ